ELTIRLKPVDGGFAFQVEPGPYCRGTIDTGDPTPADVPAMDLDALRRRSTLAIDAPDLYEKFRQAGVRLGPYCQGVEQIWLSDEAALGELRVPASETSSLAQYTLHPTLLDGA